MSSDLQTTVIAVMFTCPTSVPWQASVRLSLDEVLQKDLMARRVAGTDALYMVVAILPAHSTTALLSIQLGLQYGEIHHTDITHSITLNDKSMLLMMDWGSDEFSKLDMGSGSNRILVHPDSKVCGNTAETGSWNPEQTPISFPMHSGLCVTPLSSPEKNLADNLEFKLIKKISDDTVDWEPPAFINKQVPPPLSDGYSVVYSQWGKLDVIITDIEAVRLEEELKRSDEIMPAFLVPEELFSVAIEEMKIRPPQQKVASNVFCEAVQELMRIDVEGLYHECGESGDGGKVLDGKVLVDDGKVPVSDGKVPMNDRKVPSDNGKVPVSYGKVPVSNGKVPSANGKVPVVDGKVLSAYGKVLPAEIGDSLPDAPSSGHLNMMPNLNSIQILSPLKDQPKIQLVTLDEYIQLCEESLPLVSHQFVDEDIPLELKSHREFVFGDDIFAEVVETRAPKKSIWKNKFSRFIHHACEKMQFMAVKV